jgi:hypothetical protein
MLRRAPYVFSSDGPGLWSSGVVLLFQLAIVELPAYLN